MTDELAHTRAAGRRALGFALALAEFTVRALESRDLLPGERDTELFPGVLMTKAYGEVLIPDRFRVTVEAESQFPRSYLEISIITIDDTSYMTGIFSGRWSEVSPESLPFNLSG